MFVCNKNPMRTNTPQTKSYKRVTSDWTISNENGLKVKSLNWYFEDMQFNENQLIQFLTFSFVSTILVFIILCSKIISKSASTTFMLFCLALNLKRSRNLPPAADGNDWGYYNPREICSNVVCIVVKWICRKIIAFQNCCYVIYSSSI